MKNNKTGLNNDAFGVCEKCSTHYFKEVGCWRCGEKAESRREEIDKCVPYPKTTLSLLEVGMLVVFFTIFLAMLSFFIYSMFKILYLVVVQ